MRSGIFLFKLKKIMYHNEEPQRHEKLLEIESKFKDLDIKILTIDAKLTQVVEAILGNSLTNQGGFMNEMNIMQRKLETLESKMEVQEEFRKKFLWTVVLISAIGALAQFIFHLYAKLKN